MNDTAEPNPRLAFFQSRIGHDLSDSVSPLGRWLGGTLRAAEPGVLEVDFEVRSELTNPMGVLHGGASAAIMDEVIGMMVFSLGREYGYTSVNLNCDFLSAARLGDLLSARARVVRAGRTVIHCECEIRSSQGKIVAKSSSNLIQTSVKIPN